MASQQGFQISVKSDIDAFMRRITEIEQRDVPFVTAYALTKTAQDIKAEEVVVMAQVFDRPTRFALNALYVVPATKAVQKAQVLFKDGFGSVPAYRFLGPQVEGGARVKKSHERALERAGILDASEFVVPGRGAKLDAYGNMQGGVITRILSELQANPDPLANSTARSRKRRKGRPTYFVSRDNPRMRDGVYQRQGRSVKPLMMFVRQPVYQKRLPFYETAQRVFEQNFARHFREGWQRYVVARGVRAA